ncbi:MAG: hypothetical protein ABSG86_17155 [Thermoguttaceae bacterium]|jgi:hypothetical protein
MNADNALEHELQRFGAVVISMHSVVDDVMARVMEQPLTVRRRHRVNRLLAASAAGLAACLAVAITTWILTHRGKPADPGSTASTGGAPRETLTDAAKVETPSMPAASSFAFPPLSETRARASAIVRGKTLRLKGGLLDCEVIRVIYGRVDEKVVHVRHVPERGTNEEVGREVILYLNGRPQRGHAGVWEFGGMAFDVPPQQPLDEYEKMVVTAIKAGSHREFLDLDTNPNSGISESVSARVEPPAMRFAVSTVVRAKMLSLENNVLDCEVIRVIYGRVSGKAVRVAATDTEESVRNLLRQRARESKKEVLEPSAAEVRAAVVRENRFVVGREVILILRRPLEGTNPAVWLPGGMSWGHPPERPLDKQEKEVVEEIKTGAYLRPDTLTGKLEAYELGPYTVRSERVVRARLVKIGETSAQWQVSGVLCVAPPPGQSPGSAPAGNHPAKALQAEKPATICVDLATWRLRAETIARYRAAQQPGTAVKEEDVQVEYTRLLKDELPLGREAILFIRPREKPEDGTAYKLIGILYGDADKANRLDQFDKAIREIHQQLGLGLQREE